MANILCSFRRYEDFPSTLKKEAQEKIMDFLRRDYNLLVNYGIDQMEASITAESNRQIPIDGVLSNCPPTKPLVRLSNRLSQAEVLEACYRNTLNTLNTIREKASKGKRIPLIIYTSASREFESVFRSYVVDALIFKVNVDNWEKEAREIKASLDRLVK